MCRPFVMPPRVPRGYEVNVHIHDTDDGIQTFCGTRCGEPLLTKITALQVLKRDQRRALTAST